MSVEPPRKKVKAGGNWKKLQKTLVSDDKPRRVSSSSSNNKIDKGKSRVQNSNELRESSSPAPTTLPWFAEDLSPEDLALVRKSSSRSSLREATSGGSSGGRQGVYGDFQQQGIDEDADSKNKKRAILGGQDLSEEKKEPGTYVAIDCEMVGVGPEGSESVLARVSIVNWHGAVLYDSFVQPQEKVTDYRTWVSGVRPQDLQSAPSFQSVQSQVAKLIKGRVLVGHAIHNDLKALLLSHPKPLIRDTAQNKLCRELANSKYPSLKKLVTLRLGIDIQQSGAEHSSVEDARATMALYRTLHSEWQKSMATPSSAIIAKGWKNKKRLSEGGEGNQQPSSAAKASKATKLAKATSSAQDPEWWKQV